MGEFVRVQVADGVATLRLDRPKMNAINDQLLSELREAAGQARDRADVRAVVLYGGERVFAAGADVEEMSRRSYPDLLAWAATLQDTFRLLARLPMPVVAAVNGYALGGGLELALTADFRVLGARAKVGAPEIQLGIIPGAGGTQRLTRLVGPARAKAMVYTGRQVGAEEAVAIGLADRAVPDGEVLETALAMAATFVPGPALALRAAKQAIDDGLDGDLDSGLRLETALFSALFATRDQKAGMASFLESGPGKAQFFGQ